MGRSGEKMDPVTGNGSIFGSYIHGIFDAPGIAEAVLKALCDQKNVDYSLLRSFDIADYKEKQYDRLADAVRSGLDMELVYKIIGLK